MRGTEICTTHKNAALISNVTTHLILIISQKYDKTKPAFLTNTNFCKIIKRYVVILLYHILSVNQQLFI